MQSLNMNTWNIISLKLLYGKQNYTFLKSVYNTITLMTISHQLTLV